jgi:hypothetical protein
MVSLMCNVSVVTHFASDVEMNHIDPVIVNNLAVGESRTLMRVKILLGLWQIQNNVQNAEIRLKKIKDVII